MKKSFLVLTVALAGAVAPLAVLAQDAPPGGAPAGGGGPRGGAGRMNPEERLKNMKETLGLNDDQVTKIKAIFEADAPKLKSLRDDTALSQEDRRAKLREIIEAQTKQINDVLTPDQQTKWKEEMEKRRANRGAGRAGGGAGAGGAAGGPAK